MSSIFTSTHAEMGDTDPIHVCPHERGAISIGFAVGLESFWFTVPALAKNIAKLREMADKLEAQMKAGSEATNEA